LLSRSSYKSEPQIFGRNIVCAGRTTRAIEVAATARQLKKMIPTKNNHQPRTIRAVFPPLHGTTLIFSGL
jgi:hypothetical protein